MKQSSVTTGFVYLVGAGPGDPELLTLRALRLIQQADAVVYDQSVSSAIAALIPDTAEQFYLGQTPEHHALLQEDINQLLIRLAQQGKCVLHLTGGDPFIFERGAEEIETLLLANIRFQIVPGITAALGSAAYAGIPLTHRDYAQNVIFSSGFLPDHFTDFNWQVLAHADQTLVFYLEFPVLETLCQQLIQHGLPPEHPAALIEQATLQTQRVIIGTLSNLAIKVHTAKVQTTSLIIVGKVVKLHEKLHWFNTLS